MKDNDRKKVFLIDFIISSRLTQKIFTTSNIAYLTMPKSQKSPISKPFSQFFIKFDTMRPVELNKLFY
jgi:hypothetical protein